MSKSDLIPSLPARWTNVLARKAREAFIDELEHHNMEDALELYNDGNSEKYIAVVCGVMASNAILNEDEKSRKIYMGIMFLATYLHEAKHSRPGSEMATKLFWLQLERAHPGSIEKYLGGDWQSLVAFNP